MRRWIGLVVAVGLAIVSVPVAAASGRAAVPAAGSVGSDFDGDGFGDLAIGVPAQDVMGRQQAGAVRILYGSATGLSSARSQMWSPASEGIPGAPRVTGYFGTSVATGDFDGDGFGDLAVGAGSEANGQVPHSGAVYVLYGGGEGLSAEGARRFTQGNPGIPDRAEDYDTFGGTLAAGDFGRGIQDDLAISASEGFGEEINSGAVTILYGSGEGLLPTGAQLWSQQGDAIAGAPESGDGFGLSLVAADLGGSDQDDLAIGAPGDATGNHRQGSVTILFGSATGLGSAGHQRWTPGRAGMVGGDHDRFGASLAAGEFGRGGFADLAVGAPGRGYPAFPRGYGVIVILYGRSAGLSAQGSQVFDQGDTGTGMTEEGDRFGERLAAGDLGRGPRHDLVVGVPQEAIGDLERAGAFSVLYGSPTGITTAGAQGFPQNGAGVGAAPEEGDVFGSALFVADFGGGEQADVAVGAPGEGIGTTLDAGFVVVLYGTPNGVSTTGAQGWHENLTGGAVESLGLFGAALA